MDGRTAAGDDSAGGHGGRVKGLRGLIPTGQGEETGAGPAKGARGSPDVSGETPAGGGDPETELSVGDGGTRVAGVGEGLSEEPTTEDGPGVTGVQRSSCAGLSVKIAVPEGSLQRKSPASIDDG